MSDYDKIKFWIFSQKGTFSLSELATVAYRSMININTAYYVLDRLCEEGIVVYERAVSPFEYDNETRPIYRYRLVRE